MFLKSIIFIGEWKEKNLSSLKQIRNVICNLRLQKDLDFSNKILFVDKSEFNIFGSDGCPLFLTKMWCKSLKKQNIPPTVKQHGGQWYGTGCQRGVQV